MFKNKGRFYSSDETNIISPRRNQENGFVNINIPLVLLSIEGRGLANDCWLHFHFSMDRGERSSYQLRMTWSRTMNILAITGFLDGQTTVATHISHDAGLAPFPYTDKKLLPHQGSNIKFWRMKLCLLLRLYSIESIYGTIVFRFLVVLSSPSPPISSALWQAQYQQSFFK